MSARAEQKRFQKGSDERRRRRALLAPQRGRPEALTATEESDSCLEESDGMEYMDVELSDDLGW